MPHLPFGKEWSCDLLYCRMLANWINAPEESTRAAMCFCGFEYGYYLGTWNHFSAVHNDVIYGRYDDLRAFARHLNSHLLLPALETVSALHAARTNLLHDGAELEHDEPFIPIAVYQPRLD